MWQCPKCNRSFKNNNQFHSCETYTEEDHLKDKDDFIKELYTTLLNVINKHIEKYTIDSVHCCIHLVTQTTFAAIELQNSSLKISFISKKPIKSKLIMKQEIYSANRVNNIIKVFKKDDIDEELIDWLKAAYEITKQ